MERSGAGPRLIIVCGLPGSGKTAHAKLLEGRLRAIRLSPNEWMDALSLDLYDEGRREKIEALQWKFGQELLALGMENPPIERDQLLRWVQIFQVPTPEEIALFDKPSYVAV
jgi:dephospho-CoA kinase